MAISILIGSTRRGRQTPRVAKLIKGAIDTHSSLEARMVDLADFTIPFLEERLKYLSDPAPDIVRFSRMVKASSALVVVSPEYNGACPAVLKNALDHLNEEYEALPVLIATVSAGPHGGRSCYQMLHTLFSRVGAQVLETHMQVNRVEETVSEDGSDVGGRYAEQLAEIVKQLGTAIR